MNRRVFLKKTIAMAAGLATRTGWAKGITQAEQDAYDLATYDFLIARVKFDSDGRTGDRWNIVPAGDSNLLKALEEVMRCKVKSLRVNQSVTYGSPNHFNAIVDFDHIERTCHFPFLLMTSDGAYRFNSRQKLNFKTYVEHGGFVTMDDCVFGHDGDFFFQSSFQMLQELFGSAFTRIPLDHEIFHNVYDMTGIGLPFIQGQRRGAWGVFVGNRLAVLLSPGDLHCGWADGDGSWYGRNGRPGCDGHEECIHMGINIATYAMSH